MSTIEKALNAMKAKQEMKNSSKTAVEPEPSLPTDEPTQLCQEEVEQASLDLEPLTIEAELLDRKGMVTETRKSRLIRDEYRNIKLKLLANAFGAGRESHPNGNLIMVSSSNPGEGKTFTSINLALSMALEQDKTVLLVDADVLKPSVMKNLELESKPGLMEYLSGEVDTVGEVIYPTNINKLRIMPAGMPHDLSNELLTSEKMATLASELASRYSDRVVIFDCPPLLGINETRVMSKLVGQALIVIEQDQTKLAQVNDAIEELDRNLAIGFVINKAVRGAFNQHGYGYGYGYGYGQTDDDKNIAP